MSFSDLYNYVASLDEAPIKVENVIDAKIIEITAQDEIYYTPVEIDREIALGYMKQYRTHEVPYGEAVWTTHIFYSKELNWCWKRFVCCKELMHLFDSAEERADTIEKFDILLNQLTAPPPLTEDFSPMLRSERRAQWMAMAALCPLPYRDHFRPKWRNGDMTDYDVALALRIPEDLIRPIMADSYADIVQMLQKY